MVDLVAKAKWVRRTALEMAVRSGRGHLGSAFSCVDILVALYYGRAFDHTRDRFILSKGHASLALYPILADLGYFQMSEMEHFAEPGALLTEHPTNRIPGIVTTAGSLGHGLAIGVGLALAEPTRRVFVLMGDGECDEGSVWEGAKFAADRRVNNLIALVDNNGYGATGRRESSAVAFQGFGWDYHHANGHNHYEIEANCSLWGLQAIDCHTTKGCGVGFMESGWHHQQLTAEQADEARRQLA